MTTGFDHYQTRVELQKTNEKLATVRAERDEALRQLLADQWRRHFDTATLHLSGMVDEANEEIARLRMMVEEYQYVDEWKQLILDPTPTERSEQLAKLPTASDAPSA